jgi:hypothetical protein
MLFHEILSFLCGILEAEEYSFHPATPPPPHHCLHYATATVIKKETKFSSYTYKEIHMGAVAKSYMRMGFLMYEETQKYLTIYESYMTLQPVLLNFLIYEENSIFFFISVMYEYEEQYEQFMVEWHGSSMVQFFST